MSGLFPHNPDITILSQPEIEYRNAKYPFRVKHTYIAKETGEHKHWVSTHCPVCFWNHDIDFWSSLIDKGTKFCRRCGQKIYWDDDDGESEQVSS